MSSPQNDQSQTVRLLAVLDSLHLKAFAAESRQALTFIMLNDSVQLARYDRAMLWAMNGSKPELIGISGQREPKDDSPYAESCRKIVQEIRNPQTPQTLSQHSLIAGQEEWEKLRESQHQPNVHWLPIVSFDKLQLGLWLERWNDAPWAPQEVDSLKFLAQGYGLAWRPYVVRFFSRMWSKRHAAIFSVFAILALTFIQLPLRVVAPCEIVPRNPAVITAPLEGIVSTVNVSPGQVVSDGEVLFEYDKKVLTQALRVAEKELEIAEAELHRTTTEAFEEEQSLDQIRALRLELEKRRVNLALAQYHFNQLEVQAPIDGIVSIDNPDEWRGKPVRVGERVMVLSTEGQTKLRIWIPENDNITILKEVPIQVFLNTRPESGISAKLDYIADHTKVSTQGVPSFQAEAQWAEQDEGVKVGLKGTAILYGENVSLFYWLVRRPWASFRRLFGW